MVNAILHIVYAKSHPKHLQKRLTLTNALALYYLFFVAIPFTCLSLLYLPTTTAIPPLIAGVACILALILNYFGGIFISRSIIALTPILFASSYHAMLTGGYQTTFTSISMLELSFALIPLVLFDWREKGMLLFCAFISVSLILLKPDLSSWFLLQDAAVILGQSWLSVPLKVLALVNAYGCMTALLYILLNAEKKLASLRLSNEEKQVGMLKAQEKLATHLQELTLSRQEEQSRQWISEGIAMFSRLIQQNNDDDTIFDKLISSIVKYLKANQGGLFIVDHPQEEPVIKLRAAYAYGKKKHLEKEILPGQGLIGQVYREKQFMYFKDIPQGYVTITSGLGEATPTSLIILPLINHCQVQGLIEIASFHLLEPHQLELLDKLSEVLAAHIHNQRNIEQTNILLEQYQQQTELLQAQEEIMRQNMGQINVHQQEMYREKATIEQELKHSQQMQLIMQEHEEKLKVLFNSGREGIIMIDTQGKIELFNQAAEQMFLYPAEEVIGRNIKSLMPEQYSAKHDAYLERYRQTNNRHVIGVSRTVNGQRKDKSIFPVEIRLEEGTIQNKKVFVGYLKDLTLQDIELFEEEASNAGSND